MKKMLFLNVVMVLALFFLGGCFLDKARYFSYDELKNNVERVETVSYTHLRAHETLSDVL